jgi:cytoskeletal protein RodZ
MHLTVFLLLFVIFLVLVGIVVWTLKVARTQQPAKPSMPEAKTAGEDLPAEDDEALKWLTDFAEKQAKADNRRVH